MTRWLRRIRGALGMGLSWAVAGALLGFGMEFVDPHGAIADIWPMVLAVPAFFGGVSFSVVLGIAGRRRRFDELSIPGFAAWGAAAGALLSLVPVALVALGLATPNVPVWRISLTLLGPLTAGSAVAASGTLWLARLAERGDRREVEKDIARVGLTEDETRDLLGG